MQINRVDNGTTDLFCAAALVAPLLTVKAKELL